MKSKILLAVLLLFSNIYVFGLECSCGSFEDGMYDYSVIDNTGGCCTGRLTGNAWFTTYRPGEGLSWEVVDVTRIQPIDAQRACCPAS